MTRWVRAGMLAALASLPAANTSAQVVEYYHLDAVGTVRAVTDASGQLAERHDSLPFGEEWCGNVICNGVTPGQPRRFAGKERDTETGNDYFGARYYGARLGRFTTNDPKVDVDGGVLDPQRWNRYAYALNNPLRKVDPDGEDTIDLAIGFGKGVGTVAAGIVIAPIALLSDPAGAVKGAATSFLDTTASLNFAAHHPGYLLDTYIQLSTSNNAADQEALGSAFGQGSAVAALTFAPAAKGTPAPAQVQLNRAAGNAFRDEIVGLLRNAGRGAETEVYKKTPFGKRYIDIEVSLGGKILGGIETKVGRSRYNASQRAKDWWLRHVENYPVNVVRDR